MNNKQRIVAALVAVMIAGGAGIAWSLSNINTVAVKAKRIPLDLAHPDVVMASKSLAQLPKDLLTVPLLKATLTEDLAFYYDNHEDRLGLIGAFKRIAYEHNVSLADQLLAEILDQPAEVVLWRGQGGRLDHYLLSVQRSGLAQLMELAAKVVADKDQQLQKTGDLALANGATVAVYRLQYGRGRQLFFTSYDQRLLLATDSQLMLGTDKDSPEQNFGRQQTISALLLNPQSGNPYLQQFHLTDTRNLNQSIAVTASYLTFGYGDLFQDLQALRFDFGAGQWSTWGQFQQATAQKNTANNVWATMPSGAALCGQANINWTALQPALANISQDAATSTQVTQDLAPASAVCWYAKSSYYAPVIMAQLNNASRYEAYFSHLLTTAWRKGADKSVVKLPTAGAVTRWQASGEQFQPTMVRLGNIVAFSPDPELMDQVQTVADKRYPALADSLANENVALYVQPQQLAALLKSEVENSLPQESEPVFAEAANKHLMPRLATLATYPPFVLTYPKNETRRDGVWQALDWHVLK